MRTGQSRKPWTLWLPRPTGFAQVQGFCKKSRKNLAPSPGVARNAKGNTHSNNDWIP